MSAAPASLALTRTPAAPLKWGHFASHVILIAGAVAMLLPFAVCCFAVGGVYTFIIIAAASHGSSRYSY